MDELFEQEQLHEQEDFHRGLKNRHIQLIAIGGAIGVGLFLASVTASQRAGRGLIPAYAVGGLIIFFITSWWSSPSSWATRTSRR